MSLPQPQQPVTNEVLAYQIHQVQETLRQVLARLDVAASKSDVDKIEVRVRVLEDDRVAARAVLAIFGLLGVGGVGALLKWLLSA